MKSDNMSTLLRPIVTICVTALFVLGSIGSHGVCQNPVGDAESQQAAEAPKSTSDQKPAREKTAAKQELHDAVREGQLENVKAIIARAPQLINVKDSSDGYPPLHWAVIDDHIDVARFLLSKGADVNLYVRSDTSTPIFAASTGNMAKLLLKHGADVKVKEYDSDRTPLEEAAEAGYVVVVKVLMAAGAKLTFDSAVELGWTEAVAEKLKEKPWLAKLPRKPLHSAASQGNLKLVKLLLKHGADPEVDFAFANTGPYTPLTSAVIGGHFEISRLLMEAGADPNVSAGRNHDNLFLYAIAYLDARFVKAMLDAGADVQRGDSWGHNFTPLHVAAALGGTADAGHVSRVGQPQSLRADRLQVMEKVKALLESGAKIDARTDDGATPLIFAALAGHRDVCDLLIKRGANPDIYSVCILGQASGVAAALKTNPKAAMGKQLLLERPPLHWAAWSGNSECVELLLRHEADPNAMASMLEHQDASGFAAAIDDVETALHVAARRGHTDVVRLLIEAGADLETATKQYGDAGSTALTLACEGAHLDVVRLLLERGATIGSQHSALIAAVHAPKILVMLLDANKDIELNTELGTQLVTAALLQKNEEAARLLLERGAPHDLSTACMLGDAKAAGRLLKRNPSLLNQAPSDGSRERPIVLAVQNGRRDVVSLLISQGAETDPDKLDGISLIHVAAEQGHQQQVDQLLGYGFTLQDRDDHGATLLHAAASGAHPYVVKFLLANHSSVHETDSSGETPLHAVSSGGLFYWSEEKEEDEIVRRIVLAARVLLDAGAIVNAKDETGSTALHGAASNGLTELAKMLIAAGADVNARTERNETPLYWAQSGHPFSDRDLRPVAELLQKHGGKR